MIIFRPWREFYAFFDRKVVTGFLREVASDSKRAFQDGMVAPKSGAYYRISGARGLRHRASASGEYPGIPTGRLYASIGTQVTRDSATVGTNRFYSRFLREGTRKMARRKMSDDALAEGIKTARHKLKGFATWKR